MKEVFRFNYDNIELLTIMKCKVINDNIVYELTDDELNMINYVFSKVKLTNDRVKLPNYQKTENLTKAIKDNKNLDKDGNLCFDIICTSITTNYSYNTNIAKIK